MFGVIFTVRGSVEALFDGRNRPKRLDGSGGGERRGTRNQREGLKLSIYFTKNTPHLFGLINKIQTSTSDEYKTLFCFGWNGLPAGQIKGY